MIKLENTTRIKIDKNALNSTAFDHRHPAVFLARLHIKAIAIRPVSGLVTITLRLPRYCFNKTIAQWPVVKLESLTVAGAA